MSRHPTFELVDVVADCIEQLGATVIESDDMAAFAVEYAAAGWEVFPLNGKIPAIPKRAGGRGVLDATTDRTQIAAWWAMYPGANIGLRVAPHAIVIDTDPRHGGDVGLADLIDQFGPLPTTLTSASGRGDGGRHYFFRRPFGRLTSRRLPRGIDLKTNGGYVVAPPSIHPDTGGRYTWVDEAPIADPPPWLTELLAQPPPVLNIGTKGAKGTKLGGTSVADAFTETSSWTEILEPHGWRCTSPDPDADGAVWLHPAATSACSASVRHGCLFVWSPNTPFDVSEPGSPAGLTKFRAFAHLNHGGDLSAAARALRS